MGGSLVPTCPRTSPQIRLSELAQRTGRAFRKLKASGLLLTTRLYDIVIGHGKSRIIFTRRLMFAYRVSPSSHHLNPWQDVHANCIARQLVWSLTLERLHRQLSTVDTPGQRPKAHAALKRIKQASTIVASTSVAEGCGTCEIERISPCLSIANS